MSCRGSGRCDSVGPAPHRPIRRSRLCAALLAAAAGLVLLAPSAGARTVDSYCGPSGDYCYRITKVNGEIRFILAGFNFTGTYRTCVGAPDGSRSCR
jgi:hypothetical protein